MKNFSITLILVLSFIAALQTNAIPSEDSPSCVYSIDGGNIILHPGESPRVIPVTGTIVGHCHGDDGIYYIAIKSDIAAEPFIGCVDLQSGTVRYEKKLPHGTDTFILDKLMVSEGIAYILTETRTVSGTVRVLNRINLNSMNKSILEDVLDFHVDRQGLILLKKRERGMVLCRNETVVPVTLSGECILRIGKVVDGRMVFITDGIETEIFDMISGRGVYSYSVKRELLLPTEYNLAVDAKDIQGYGQDDREMVFYKVFINGIESGRTDSGPAGLSREFRVKVDASKYHSVKLERWVLNAPKGRYERENNIRQPKAEQIYMPMNRIVKLNVTFNGKNYEYSIATVYK